MFISSENLANMSDANESRRIGAYSVHSFYLKAGFSANGHHSQCEVV